MRQWITLLHLLITGACLAADKSAVGPSAISVPKGPGSIEGLGESFQPSLNTGTAKYGVGMQVPPGTAGQAPKLGLSYEGGGGNGPLGIGWSLPHAYIQCRTDKGIPTYGQNVGFLREDRYINEMKEELVPQANGYWFCENEGAFVRYRRVGDRWEGTAPDGSRMEFGLTGSGRIQDGTNGARVFCWMLEKETDTRGNTILYTYSAFSGAQNTNQKYLVEIRYGPGAPPWENFHFARFIYEDRPDWFEDCRSGFVVRTGKRLKSVVIGTQGPTLANHLAGDFNSDGTTDYLVRRYELGYLDYAGTNSHWSLLARVQLTGADGVTTLPAATFGYNVCNPTDVLSAEGKIIGSLNEPGVVMDSPLIDLVDLNGDGLPDLLETQDNGGAHRGYLNLGQTNNVIVWSAPQEIGAAEGGAWTYNLRSDITEGQSVHLADMDGDGSADLNITSFLGDVYYCANSNHLGWGSIIPMTGQDVAPPSPFGDNQTRSADMDFDKRIDIVQSLAGAYDIWFNLGNHTYSPRVRVGQNPGYDFSDKTVHLGDFNGDRVPDLMVLSVATLEVSAGLGYGKFAPAVSVSIPDAPLEDFQVLQARLQDITGDGLPELVIERATLDTLWYWINLGNYTFGPRKVLTGMPSILSPGAVRWADLNGDGATDLIYGDSTAAEGEKVRLVDLGDILNGGQNPNMLVAISNGIGSVTLIGYVSSTQFSLEDAAAGQPWPDPMPFPVQVIGSITNLDSLGHQYVTRFRYHDAYYDPVEKQFRGFARAEQVSVGDPSAPTLVSRSYFDTGRTHEAMKGKLLRATTETEDGRVFTDGFTAWTVPPRVLMTGTNGQTVNYVNAVGSTNLTLELGQGTPRRLESETDYDQFGNQTRAANYGIVENGDRTAFDDERITLTEYAINTNAWIIRAPKRQLVQDENGAVIARSESFYDDETFSGNNLGSVTIGNLTLTRAWIDPSNSEAFVNSARIRYDAYGNGVTTLAPLAIAPGGAIDLTRGHVREVAYDDRFHTYPKQETLHVGQGREALVFRADYDPGLGTTTQTTDFNQNQTRYVYDTFGRLIQFIKPGDSPDYPSTEYAYSLAVLFGPKSLVNFVETQQLDKTPGSAGANKRDHYHISRAFTDGLGRALMNKQEAEPAPGGTTPRVVISGAVLFNARQKPEHSLNVCFSLLPGGTLDELLAYESVEAAGWNGVFHLNGQLIPLNLSAAHQSSVIYDASLRPIKTVNADGTFSRLVYEPLVTQSFDENDTDPASPHFNTPMVHASDGLGRMIRAEETVHLNDDGSLASDVKAWTTAYEYNLNDSLIRVTDSQGNVKTMAYDGLKRKTVMHDPDCGVVTYRYDDASNLIETTDAKGQRMTFTYDGLNRMLTEDYHDENSTEFSYHRSPDVIYHYDMPPPSVDQGDGTRATARNTKGVLAYVEDASGENHTSFDARGRVAWSVKRIVDPLVHSLSALGAPGREVPLISYKTAFEYDSSDRVTRTIYPDNDQISYEYNARNLTQRIVGGPSGSIISAFDYLPSAQESQFDYGNGVRTTYAYDKRARLTQLSTLHSQLSTVLIDFAYDFDGVSNIKAIHDQRAAAAVALADKRRNTQTFTYDDLYRLTRVQYNLPTPSPVNGGEINYRYDRLGNMLAQTSDITHVEKGRSVTDLGAMSYGGTAGRFGRVGRQNGDPPGPHALSEITNPKSQIANRKYPYDANGNMTEIDGLRCTWDFKDRLVAVEDDTMRAQYIYDCTDRRITKRVTAKANSLSLTGGEGQGEGATATIYVTKSFEVRDHDQPTKYVFNGATRVARITGSLSTNTRIQRFRIYAGWNLVSLAVTAPNALRQMTNSQFSILNSQSVVRWNQPTLAWLPISPDETLPAGTVLWLRAVTNATLTLTGHFTDVTNQPITIGGSFHPSIGFEVFPLLGERAGVRADVALWHFDSASQRWRSRLPAIPSFDAGFPEFLAPGSGVFVQSDSPAELEVPEAALRIRYYHQDHLGSSSVMSDANGALVDETAFYPFGEARHKHRPRQIQDPYQFAQKERDGESGLDYFEARYLAAQASRFLSVDPKYADIDAAPSEPRMLNLYAYAGNNPLTYVDPTGLDWGDPYAGAEKWNDTAMIMEAASEGAERAAAFFPNAIKDAIAGMIGINTANAPGFDKQGNEVTTYPSLSYEDHAKNIVITVGGGKLLNTGANLIGKAFGSQSASIAASAPKRVVDPLAKTQAGGPFATTQVGGPFAKTQPMGAPTSAPKGPGTGTMGSRGSGVGEVRAPIRGGGTGGGLDPQSTLYMEIFQAQNEALKGMRRMSLGGPTSIESTITHMAFQQADMIWLMTYGTRPPIRVPGSR